MWDSIVLVPYYCLSFHFIFDFNIWHLGELLLIKYLVLAEDYDTERFKLSK